MVEGYSGENGREGLSEEEHLQLTSEDNKQPASKDVGKEAEGARQVQRPWGERA